MWGGGADVPEEGGEAGRGSVLNPGATAFRAVDEEEVPKELVFYPEDWGERMYRRGSRELKPEYTQIKVLLSLTFIL